MELRTFKHLKPLPSHHDDSSFRKNKHCFALSLSQKGLWHTLWSSATCPAWKCGICHRHLHGEKASDVASWHHARWTKSWTSWSMNCQWMGNHTELQCVPRTRCDEGWGTFHLPFASNRCCYTIWILDPYDALVRTHTVALQTQEKTEMRSGHCPRLIDGEPD
jgi:hypothetical protein